MDNYCFQTAEIGTYYQYCASLGASNFGVVMEINSRSNTLCMVKKKNMNNNQVPTYITSPQTTTDSVRGRFQVGTKG